MAGRERSPDADFIAADSSRAAQAIPPDFFRIAGAIDDRISRRFEERWRQRQHGAPGESSRPPASSASGCPAASRNNFLKQGETRVELFAAGDERREKPQRVIARGENQQAGVESPRCPLAAANASAIRGWRDTRAHSSLPA